MSGICVLARLDASPVDPDSIRLMVDAAPHRSTHRADVWQHHDAGVASLAAVDPPLGDRELLVRGSLVVAADARIDNVAEITPFLARRGFLATASAPISAAELLLASHRCWGRAAAAHTIGDFAYVIWDRVRRTLTAARDPMGMRPLYYRSEPRRVIAASEIKQVLAVPGVPCLIDESAMAATLAGPYLPAHLTLYAGISELEPGYVLEAGADGARSQSYWRANPAHRSAMTTPEAAHAVRTHFERAVADRLPSEHQAGLMLSGGVDSGSVGSMAGWLRVQGRVGGPPLTAYAWAFSELLDGDERSVSDEIVSHFGLRGVDIPADDAWPLGSHGAEGPDRDDPFVWAYQDLFERTVKRAAEDGVRVLLSGDHGDELLGDWVHDDFGVLRGAGVAAGIRDLRRALTESGERPSRALRHLLAPRVRFRAPWLMAAWDRMRDQRRVWPSWISDEVARRTDLADMIAEATRLPAFDGFARSARVARVFSRQSARLSVLANRTHARFGLGFADPFTDRRLIEFVLSLPQWQVQRRGEPKKLMRSAMVGVVPPQVHGRLNKVIPVRLYERGLRERSVDTVEALLADPLAARWGWMDAAAVRAAYRHYVRTGRVIEDFWWPITAEVWLRRWWA